jgi:hypothetical protein
VETGLLKQGYLFTVLSKLLWGALIYLPNHLGP